MRQTTRETLEQFAGACDWEIDADLFEETFDTQLLAGIETDLKDVEPWQRLGDLLGRITGEADID